MKPYSTLRQHLQFQIRRPPDSLLLAHGPPFWPRPLKLFFLTWDFEGAMLALGERGDRLVIVA